DALTELAGAKIPRGRTQLLRDREHVQDAVARAEAQLGAAQTFRAAAVGDVWETVASGRETTLQQRARCRIAASFAVDSARAAMDLMYRAGGTTSNERSHQLARCWRDLHVVAQAPGRGGVRPCASHRSARRVGRANRSCACVAGPARLARRSAAAPGRWAPVPPGRE